MTAAAPLRLTLPWPPAGLSPNARLHWAAKAKLTKAYRADCYWAAKAGGVPVVEPLPLALTITFCPPRAGRLDRDNRIAAFKAGQDGLAQAMGCDDSIFVPTYRMGAPTKGGAVLVEIQPC